MAIIEVIDQISLGTSRDRANEDRLGLAGPHAWVIDGATGLGEPFMGVGSDAAWLAQRAHEALTRNAVMSDPVELMSAVSDNLIASFEAERLRNVEAAWELPCGAFVLASATQQGVALTWVGDCRAIVRTGAGPLLAFGATAMSEEAEASLVTRLGQGGDPAQRYRQPEALAELRASRAIALAPNEAMILSPDRGFLKHLSQAHVAGEEIAVLLMTDGFAAAELRYGLYGSPAAMMAAAEVDGLAGIGLALRRFEHQTDPEGQLKPRWKRSDDATA
ncbi:MAG: hypothetical protein ACRCUE_09110, partial [Bosea sp. (in: a-proteobacteria)]